MDESADITRLLRDAATDAGSAEKLYEAVYDHLRAVASGRLRAERADHTLRTTALVHETYLRLVDQRSVDWQSRGQFYAVASRAIRRILVDHARHRGRDKRGGGAEHLSLTDALNVATDAFDVDLVALDRALEALRREDPVKCDVVEMRYFGGLENREIAESLGVTTRTVERHWSYAKAWLFLALEGSDD